jgi:hypothetical protein
VNHLQRLSVTNCKPARAKRRLGRRPERSAQPLHGCIVAKWNRFGIIANQNFFERLGGGGFNSLRRGLPATAHTLMQRFFSGAKTFELFLPKSKISNDSAANSFDETSPIDRAGHHFRAFIFRPVPGQSHPKNCREIPGGGVP